MEDSIIVCTKDFVVTGEIALEKKRLIDTLNSTIESAITLSKPAMEPLHGPQPKFENSGSIVVPKKEIVLAVPMETEEGIQQRSQQRLYNFQAKVLCRVFISAPPYQIIGSLNLRPGIIARDALIGLTDGFLAITKIESLTLPDNELSIPAVLIVNSANISFGCIAAA